MIWVVVGLTGMQLTFFTGAHMVLASGSVATAALTTHQCFAYC